MKGIGILVLFWSWESPALAKTCTQQGRGKAWDYSSCGSHLVNQKIRPSGTVKFDDGLEARFGAHRRVLSVMEIFANYREHCSQSSCERPHCQF
jgi:hypothetical protein